MADYHPLIARAVAGLEKNTGENRRALYERARVALVAQLRGVAPALDESEITRERLALEEAIRKVEAEAARQAREIGAAQHHQARRAAATARRRAASAAPAGRVEYTPRPLSSAEPCPRPSDAARRRRSGSRPRTGGRCRTRGSRSSVTVRAAPIAAARKRAAPQPPDHDAPSDPSLPPAPSLQPTGAAGTPSARGVRPARAADAAGEPLGAAARRHAARGAASTSMRISRRCSGAGRAMRPRRSESPPRAAAAVLRQDDPAWGWCWR